MGNYCWYDLDIDVSNCFKEGYTLPQHQEEPHLWKVRPTQVLNQDWLNYLKSKHLNIHWVMIFYRPPNANTHLAHIDVRNAAPLQPTNFAINWVYGGKGSSMVWYEPPGLSDGVKYTVAGTPYQEWDKNTLKKIESQPIDGRVKLVRTGIPHNIEMGEEPRWCISIRTFNCGWNTIVNFMRGQKLLIER